MLRADTATMRWIQGAFAETFLKIVRAESPPMSQTYIACGLDKVEHYSGIGLGVRAKIKWSHQHMRWSLQGIPNSTVDEFCKRESFMVHVDSQLTGDDYKKARQQALIDACLAWNALNTSSKRCIKLPQTAAKIEVLADQEYPDTDNESDETAGSEDEGCKPTVLASD